MVEDDLRAAFARHEHLTPPTDELRAAIDSTVRRRRRRRLTVRAAGAVLIVLVALLPGYGMRLAGLVMPEQAISGSLLGDAVAPAGPLNILVLGLDTKEPEAPRADMVFVVHVRADRTRAYLLSLPRDLTVRIPADQARGYPGGTGKLSEAFLHGSAPAARRPAGTPDLAAGARLTAATIARLTGLTFDAAVTVRFSALRAMTDAVGGVRMCIDQEVRSVHTNRRFPTGCRRLDGDAAVDLLRQRYGLPGGAFDRDRHGRQYLKALLTAVRAGGVLESPASADRLVRAAGRGLSIDARAGSVLDLVWSLRGIRAEDVVGLSLEMREQPTGEGKSRLGPEDAVQARTLFEAYLADQVDAWTQRYPASVD